MVALVKLVHLDNQSREGRFWRRNSGDLGGVDFGKPVALADLGVPIYGQDRRLAVLGEGELVVVHHGAIVIGCKGAQDSHCAVKKGVGVRMLRVSMILWGYFSKFRSMPGFTFASRILTHLSRSVRECSWKKPKTLLSLGDRGGEGRRRQTE